MTNLNIDRYVLNLVIDMSRNFVVNCEERARDDRRGLVSRPEWLNERPKSIEEILFSLNTGTLGKEGMIEFRMYERNHKWDNPPTGHQLAMYLVHLCEHIWKPIKVDWMLIHEWTPETLLMTYIRLLVNGELPIDPPFARLRVAGEILHRRVDEHEQGFNIELTEQLKGRGIAAKIVDYDEGLAGRIRDFVLNWRQRIGFFVGMHDDEPDMELGVDLYEVYNCKDPLWQFFQAFCWLT
jgi:hypothetical protein